MVDKGKIETGVDDLVRLVGSSGKISIPEVVKKLGVEQKTVETWVDFLVEEEKLSVEYKFTTPYLFLNEDKKEEDDLSITDDDVDSEIQREETDIDTSNTEFQQFISDLTKMFHDMHKMLRENKLDLAYRDYAKLCQLVSKIKDSEMSDLFNRNLIKLNDAMLTQLRQSQENLPRTIQQLQQLVTQGRTALSQGNVDQAKEVYQQMKIVYDGFPSLLVTEKTRLYDYLSMFYKNIVDKERDLTESVMHDAQGKIEDVRRQVTELIKQENVDACDQYLPTLNQIYASVPADLASYRILVYNKILKIYQEIKIAKKFKELREQLQQIGSDITLPSMSEFIKQHVPSDGLDTLDIPKPTSQAPMDEPAFPEPSSSTQSMQTQSIPASTPETHGPQPGKLNFNADEVANKGFLGLMKKPEDQEDKKKKADVPQKKPSEVLPSSNNNSSEKNPNEQEKKDDFLEPTFPEVSKEGTKEDQAIPNVQPPVESKDTSQPASEVKKEETPIEKKNEKNVTNVKQKENKNEMTTGKQNVKGVGNEMQNKTQQDEKPVVQESSQDIPPGIVEEPPQKEIDDNEKRPVFMKTELLDDESSQNEVDTDTDDSKDSRETSLAEVENDAPQHPMHTDVLPPPQLRPSDMTVGELSKQKQEEQSKKAPKKESFETPEIPDIKSDASITSPVPLTPAEPISNEIKTNEMQDSTQKQKDEQKNSAELPPAPVPQKSLIKQELPVDIPEPPMPSFNKNALDNVPKVAVNNEEPQDPELLFGDDDPLDNLPPRSKSITTDDGIIKAETLDLYRQYVTPVLHTSQLQKKFGQDEKLKDAINAYHKKDYFRAKELFDSVLHYDPDNAKAKQMSELLKGLLADKASA